MNHRYEWKIGDMEEARGLWTSVKQTVKAQGQPMQKTGKGKGYGTPGRIRKGYTLSSLPKQHLSS